ncbi:MAG: hypothetical protein WD271_12870 [Acidimicrobiia bacterium]
MGLVLAASLATALVIPAAAAVSAPPGAAKPNPGSGIGTAAALDNPKCTHDEPRFGVYGRFNSTVVGGGPVCVKPWKDGDDNGGATAPGVTMDRILVYAIIPNDQQLSMVGGATPMNRVDNSKGTYQNAIHDYLLPLMQYYETWGRNIEMRFYVSTGQDEAAQRADAITIKAEKPFAVMDLAPTALDVFDTEMAKAKILVFGFSTTTQKALAQAPYRWGQSDTQAAASNSTEVIGKQLVHKKAKFGGDDVKSRTRKFGTVYIQDIIDVEQMKSNLKKYGGTIASEASYTANGSTIGDATSAQEQAPVIATKLKEAGVTTVILFTDVAMTRSLMDNATKQEWFPEWFFTGTVFHDLALLARSYPVEQSSHAFGISNVSPWVYPNPAAANTLDGTKERLDWYWGEGVGTTASSPPQQILWLLSGIQAAGPKLTPKTFQQGLFSLPATGGAALGYPTGTMTGYGKNAGLPYDEYMQVGIDFGVVWWDPETSGPSQGTGTEAKGVGWYANDSKRFRSGTVPKRQFSWFDKATSVYKFDTRPTPTPVYAGDCTGCPSQGGAGQAGTPSSSGFVAKANGDGDAAL